jgi:hypothetical protein
MFTLAGELHILGALGRGWGTLVLLSGWWQEEDSDSHEDQMSLWKESSREQHGMWVLLH